MQTKTAIAVFWLLFLSACGNPDSEIVGLMINPVKAEMSVGGATGFSAALQYVDGHQTPVFNVEWSIQGTCSLIVGDASGTEVTVQCVRPSDYFAGAYVGDTIMLRATATRQPGGPCPRQTSCPCSPLPTCSRRSI